ncbi:hypothetical protein SAMN06265182_0813 [Persephonella hydrogeniphila]|uniref:Uncharacterized protein n=1 Tax=Persephonella hydrogeniphila TaxID=198703 RepID=A0A285NGR3_9AQUI|nr:DsrE family protein [Persephonella hydrogeniphila]SNZ06831.1 hypothetical protein SAMN06265182_0813 [Persephonella hydrogeniphila]
MKVLIVFLLVFLFASGEEKGAKLEISESTYPSVKVVYDWNLQGPEAVDKALNYIRNHLKAYSEYAPLEEVEIVIVSHGAEIPVFAKQNEKVFQKTVERLKNFHDSYGIKFYVCYNAARAFGFDKEDFFPFVILTPAGVAKLAALQEEGYRLVPAIVHNFKPVKEKYGKKK